MGLLYLYLNTPMTNAGVRQYQATKFCTVASDICGSSGWKFLSVTFMTSRILRFPRDIFGRSVDPWTKELISERQKLGNNVPDDGFLLASVLLKLRGWAQSCLSGPSGEVLLCQPQDIDRPCPRNVVSVYCFCVLFLLLSLIPTPQTLQESKKQIRDKSNDCILR